MTSITPDRYDIFLSYPSADRVPAAELKQALEKLGLRVWMDTERIDDAASIQRSIESGLARSRVLLAWYSKAYAQSRPCQWELTAALIVAQFESAAQKRVLVLNPEGGVAHIAQTMVRDIELIQPSIAETSSALALRVQVASKHVLGLLGDIRSLARPPWHGRRRGLGSNRFVGRLSQLWQMHNALTGTRYAIVSGQPNAGAGAGLTRVRGSGGIGKSLLAEEYALRFGSFWPGGIYWLDALGVSDRPEEAASALVQRRESYRLEQLGNFAIALGLKAEGLKLGELRALIGGKLQQRGQHYLWLVDDLPACTRDQLEDWLAPSAKGTTLITSRSRQHEALGIPVDLGILDPADARALLCRERQPQSPAEKDAVSGILKRLGGHAMTLDQARAACANYGFAGFLMRLDHDDQQALRLSQELAGELPNGHQRDIARTFLSSIEGLSPDAQDLLGLLCQLSNAPVSRDLIAACKLALDARANDGDDAAGKTNKPDPLIAAEDWAVLAMQQLAGCSLADIVEVEAAPGQPAPPALVVHTLTARVARWRMTSEQSGNRADSGPSAAPWSQAAVRALLPRLRDADDFGQRVELLNDVQHARQLCEKIDTLDQASLLGWVALYDYYRGAYNAAKVAYQDVLTVRQRLQGPEHRDTLLTISNLAVTLGDTGDVRAACAMQQHALNLLRRVLGAEHAVTLASMNRLAEALHAQGDLAAARDIQEQLLHTCHQVLGPEHTDTLRCMHSLAWTLGALGDLSGALAMQRTVFNACKRVFGPEHPNTLTGMNNLAEMLRLMGDLSAARTIQAEVLETRQRLLGPEHPHTLTSMSNVALTIGAMGDVRAARAMQESALKSSQRVLGDQHPATLSSMNNLADTLRDTGHASIARAMQEEVLKTLQSALGTEHPDTLNSMNSLAETLRAFGDLVPVREMQEGVLKSRQRVLGTEHRDTLTSMHNLAGTLGAMGDLTAARAMQEDVLSTRHRVLGAEHADTLASMSNLLYMLDEAKDLAAMRAVAKQYPETVAKLFIQQVAEIENDPSRSV